MRNENLILKSKNKKQVEEAFCIFQAGGIKMVFFVEKRQLIIILFYYERAHSREVAI